MSIEHHVTAVPISVSLRVQGVPRGKRKPVPCLVSATRHVDVPDLMGSSEATALGSPLVDGAPLELYAIGRDLYARPLDAHTNGAMGPVGAYRAYRKLEDFLSGEPIPDDEGIEGLRFEDDIEEALNRRARSIGSMVALVDGRPALRIKQPHLVIDRAGPDGLNVTASFMDKVPRSGPVRNDLLDRARVVETLQEHTGSTVADEIGDVADHPSLWIGPCPAKVDKWIQEVLESYERALPYMTVSGFSRWADLRDYRASIEAVSEAVHVDRATDLAECLLTMDPNDVANDFGLPFVTRHAETLRSIRGRQEVMRDRMDAWDVLDTLDAPTV